jgi:hypothetical protein
MGPQAAALQIRQEALADRRVLRRTVPEAERVFGARATTMQCSPMWTPSMSSATRSSASRAIDRQAVSGAAVFATNRRLTVTLAGAAGADLGAGWLQAATVLSRGDAEEHMLDHATIQRVGVGNAWNVGSATSSPAARTRGRRI